MMLVFYEAIRLQPLAVMQAVCSFLGLSDAPFHPEILAMPVNQSTNRDVMPAGLRTRVEAAYRSEGELLAGVFGGHAANWLAENPPGGCEPVIRLTPSHVGDLGKRSRMPCRRPESGGQIFCVSMQRSGTTSVGDWLEAHGLRRSGSPTSVRMGWTRLWWQGDLDRIFESQEFRDAEILEDDPWWCPGMYRILAGRFPDARFILLERDEVAWFDSMCRHSAGRNPGWTDVHARIYQREEEWNELSRRNPELRGESGGLLSITEHRAHYQSIYRNHGREVRDYFAGQPGRLFYGRLDDPGVFPRMCDFAGLRHNPAIAIPKSNANNPAVSRSASQSEGVVS
jgi:hypothetical protein